MYVVVEDDSDIYNWVAAITKIYSDELGTANPGITSGVVADVIIKRIYWISDSNMGLNE